MTAADDGNPSPFQPLQAELVKMRRSNLTGAIGNVDKIIELLESTREQVADEADSHKISMAMTTLQNPVKERLDAITSDLKDVTKAQRGFGRALDKALPQRDLPMEIDTMAQHSDHVNRAITMHLLREGQFSVAQTFLKEADYDPPDSENYLLRSIENVNTLGSMAGDDDTDMDGESGLQNRFVEMYEILQELKNKNLLPAIEWAEANSKRLESKGSSLEFDLSKLQFIWLFKGPSVNNLPETVPNGQAGALEYARRHFARFQRRHMREISQLCAAMVFAPNLDASPYRHLFHIDAAFDDVSMSFTRDFCSLLGLSAESPLYVAVTAGAISLPRLLKYTSYMKEKRTEWTTENEMAFETPLPGSMIYHPIFVCPVSKEQTTEANPPILLSCGHVISKESLHGIAKGSRYKCPYCPEEGHINDTIRIFL